MANLRMSSAVLSWARSSVQIGFELDLRILRFSRSWIHVVLALFERHLRGTVENMTPACPGMLHIAIAVGVLVYKVMQPLDHQQYLFSEAQDLHSLA